jgi:glycosyltransferase involved in cell wall biosynthesis
MIGDPMQRPVICLAAIDWHYLFHRPQQLMLGLARLGHPVHYRNPCQSAGAEPENVAANLRVYRDYERVPEYVRSQAIYFIYYPAYAGWVEKCDGRFIVYDCIDDDPVFAGHEELMLERADLVICPSRSLMEKFAGRHPDLFLLSNGVDLEHYLAQANRTPPEFKPLKRTGRPIVGFSGAFYRGWVDIDLVYQIARSQRDWWVVIVGETYQWDFSGAPGNLVNLGSRPYADLPAYIHSFDVGLIPFVDNQISRGADPVKLYEYAAAGVPTVSRALPFTQGLTRPVVYSYHNERECLTAIERALRDAKNPGNSGKSRRQQFAAAHTWESKVRQLTAELGRRTRLARC